MKLNGIFKSYRKGVDLLLTSIEDVTGQDLDLIRDKTGRLTHIKQHVEKRTLHIEYTTNNRIQSVSFILTNNQKRELVRYKYDKEGRLAAAYNALDYADHYEYDKNSYNYNLCQGTALSTRL